MHVTRVGRGLGEFAEAKSQIAGYALASRPIMERIRSRTASSSRFLLHSHGQPRARCSRGNADHPAASPEFGDEWFVHAMGKVSHLNRPHHRDREGCVLIAGFRGHHVSAGIESR